MQMLKVKFRRAKDIFKKLYLAKPTSNKANYSTHKPIQIHYISEGFIVNYHTTIQIPIKIIKGLQIICYTCKVFFLVF